MVLLCKRLSWDHKLKTRLAINERMNMCKILEGLCSSMLVFFVLMMVSCSESIQEQKEPAPAQEPKIAAQEQLKKVSYYSKDRGQWLKHPSHKEFSSVEIGHLEGLNRLVLRNYSHDYVVYAYVNDDYTYSILVVFNSKCKSNTSIVTTKKFANGEPKILKCDPDGQSLVFEMKSVVNLPMANFLNESGGDDLDGFYYSVYFDEWYFEELIREVTLNKAR